MSKRITGALAGLFASVLLAAGVPALDSDAATPKPASKLPPLPVRKDAKVQPFDAAAAKVSADARAVAMRPTALPKPAAWPAATEEVVALSADAGQKFVRLLNPPMAAKSTAGKALTARLRILDRAKAEAADVSGFILTVARADGGLGDAPAQLTVDYSSFAAAYGGDWASRLKVVLLPKCVLTTPTKLGCVSPTEVGSVNNAEQQTLTAPVTVGSEERVMAVTSASASSNGDYSATSLSPASSWSAGRSSGDFTWNYPLRVPPAPAGPSPQLSIDYSAQSVDGRTAASNNQPSWIGEGFALSESYVERKYASCNDDGQAGKYDLCWKYDNATVVLNGQASELVKDGTGWRLKNDDGSRVEKIVNSVANDDNDREAWKVTTLDGTQYYFGRQYVLPGTSPTSTNSVWTVPVAGDDATEPCNGATFATSFCDQAWRWNLDYVVDPHGNAMSLWYAKETNYYAKNGATTATKAYDRGGYLTKILYGQRSDAMSATAPMQVVFTTQERCLADCGSLTSATKSRWPDVPFDQICAAGATCSKIVPTFFSRRRLEQITTQVLKGATYQSVDNWLLAQDFPDPGDNMSGRALWLDSITHTGKAATATPATPLTVSFDQVALPNRVDSDNDGISPMTKLRVGTIWTETGARITVNYAAPECVAGSNMPASEDTNAMRCYPVRWQPPLEIERDDWFHRYVVAQVRVNDVTGGADAVVTNYTYSGGAAWHYDDNALIPAKDRHWSIWRGYRTVTTSSGDPFQPGPRSRTVTSYFRGMNGDRLLSGGTKSAVVADTLGGTRADEEALTGLVREAITYAAIDSNTEVSGSLTDYWVQETAAQTIETGIVRKANLVKPSAVAARITRDAGRADLVHIAKTTYDPDTGLPTSSEDDGDPGKTDETCTVTSYAKNATAGLRGYPSRVVTSIGQCDTASANPPASRLLGDVRTLYDGGAFGAAPTKGDVTSTQRANGYTSAGAPIYQTTATTTYDALGRATASTDTLGRTATTAYTPAGAGALVQTIETSPPIVPGDPNSKRLQTKTTYLPEWGSSSQVTDPNGKVTDLDYDVLGRLTAVWLPNQSKAGGKIPNTKYTYSVSSAAPSYVRTDELNINANGYLSAFAIYDSLLRPRQSQQIAAGGGRLISETKYNSRGLPIIQNADLWDSGAPSGALAKVLDASVPNETQLTYDGAGRPTVSTFAISAQPQWSTRTVYGGDTVTTLPPNGAPATAEVKDARGQVIERREYDGPTVTPGFIDSTYTYDAGGRLTQLTTAGSTWGYGYDLLGRKISADDPDSGTTTYEYDDADRVIGTTNATQKKLINTYDNLDRKMTVHEGSKTDANLRLSWDYDASGNLGQLYQSVRYPAGKTGPAYKSKITARNVLYEPTATSVVIPSAEGTELAGTYETRIGYLPDAETIEFTDVPGGGALGTEVVRYTYDELGHPTSMKSGDAVYANDVKYTALGDPERYELGDSHNMDIINTFEAGTRRLATTVAGDVTVVANHHYSYDPAGNLLQDNNLIGNDSQCYDYDTHRRLTAAWTPSDANCATAPSVAGLGSPAPYWQSWTYTADGLRKTQTDHATVGNTTETYTYDAAQPHTVKSIATTGAAPKPTASYTYDSAGNTTSRPDPTGTSQTLGWDAENRLQKLTNSAGDTSYIYDADGNILLRKSPGKTTLYVGSLELTLDTTTRAVTSKREYSINGQAVATRSSITDLKWLVPDHHETTSVAVDSKTLAVTTRFTTPFGEIRGNDPASWPDDHGFLDKPQDKMTGLTQVGAREYDPTIGRFLSVDPLMDTADPQQMLGYTYGNNNPTSMSDPTGLKNYAGGENSGGGTQEDVRTPVDTGDDGGGGHDGGTNGGSPGGDDGGSNGGGGGDHDNSGGGGSVRGLFKKAVHHTAHAIDLGNKAWSDYTDGIAAQAADTAKGLVVGAYQQGKCIAIHDCQSQIDMVSTIVRNPGSVWNAMVEPVKQDWTNGEQTKAAGRVTFMVVETIAGTKGAGRAASVASAATRVAATRAGEGVGAKATEAAAETAAKACSFAGATPVLMADGVHKPIAEVRPGDKVLATDPETGEQVARWVTQVWVHGDTVMNVSVDGESITTTEDHPFWSVTDGRFERADELAAGELVLRADGKSGRVSGLDLASARRDVAYNLTVEGIHTYHVGRIGVLVHNECKVPLPSQVKGKTAPLTTSQAGDLAKYLGYARTNFLVQGERVFRRGNSYIVHDTTAHSGGVWKIANSVKSLQSKTTRTATTDALLNVIGE
ncbi:intein/RHS repeat-associated protein [Kribbella rubisoli]|uniref:Intein/RHS repeat-associated protein n=1 Tax=Kribbella rubisoli TaxID=3075929 RepID=A0A4Q7X1D0_9ACTN|nr:polymorphic toxin-type HINT domain-containing protein [Kribbella rubisoli]RZU16408.1 intein/RHS repeat-associated protein [Kribbella rubisoli]